MLTFHDVINISKQVRDGELANFFMVMEVYGHGTEVTFDLGSLEDGQNELSLQRAQSLEQLCRVTSLIGSVIESLGTMTS